jgi:hypothetical protein
MTFIYLRGKKEAVASCVGSRNSIKFIMFILNEHSSALDFACHCTTSERSTGSTPSCKQVVNSTDSHFITLYLNDAPQMVSAINPILHSGVYDCQTRMSGRIYF